MMMVDLLKSRPYLMTRFKDLSKLISMLLLFRFSEDLEFLIGRKPSIFWQVSWRLISPLIVLVILVFYLVTQAQEELTYLVWDPNSVSTLTVKSFMRNPTVLLLLLFFFFQINFIFLCNSIHTSMSLTTFIKV